MKIDFETKCYPIEFGPTQDDVKAVRAEARERAEAADRLKIKYDYMIKSLGGRGGGGGNGNNEENKSEEGKDKASTIQISDFYKKYVHSGVMAHGGVFLFFKRLVISIRWRMFHRCSKGCQLPCCPCKELPASKFS